MLAQVVPRIIRADAVRQRGFSSGDIDHVAIVVVHVHVVVNPVLVSKECWYFQMGIIRMA